MGSFYSIAGLTVQMDSFGRTEEQAQPYRCECSGKPDIVMRSFRDDVRKTYPSVSDDDAEYMGTAAFFYKELLKFDGFQFHSSAVVVDGRAYLFSANSGTGKSTHTGLWLRQFGERAYILNDDKPALRLIDGIWYAFGTPWSGKHDLSVNTGVPVAGIAVLERGTVNQIERYSGKAAIFDVFRQTNRSKSQENSILLLELLDKLFRDVPVWKLRCNMEPEAAVVSYEAMSGKRVKEME